MAISSAPRANGPMGNIGKVAKGNTQKAQQKRLKPDRKVEKQQVREARPSRRAQEDAATERARARRAQERRGSKLDVKA